MESGGAVSCWLRLRISTWTSTLQESRLNFSDSKVTF
jgi:hypothetical protein